MKKELRILTLVLAMLVAFVMLSSAVFIITEAGHDCIGDDCPVCNQVSLCENVICAISTAIVVAIVAGFVKTSCIRFSEINEEESNTENPVFLRVKLLN